MKWHLAITKSDANHVGECNTGSAVLLCPSVAETQPLCTPGVVGSGAGETKMNASTKKALLAKASAIAASSAVVENSAGDAPKARGITISAPKLERATIKIVGITPLVLHAFAAKGVTIMKEKHEAGSQATKGKKKEARVFEENYQGARHLSVEGWDGIPAAAFRNAMISACRTVGFKMTIAKMSVFCIADGAGHNGDGLVKITKGECHMDIRPVRNSTGVVDLRARPMWPEGWEAVLTLEWDAEQFSATDVVNLLARAGLQVGVGEGRPDSKMSAGVGWGQFRIAD